ncbi:MAG: DUF1559 domain-containing protein [Rubripirellula sp.]
MRRPHRRNPSLLHRRMKQSHETKPRNAPSTSSRHQGGTHILMGDGAVVFITDSIETGDQTAPSISFYNTPGKKSPYGLWGALGTRASKETIEESF